MHVVTLDHINQQTDKFFCITEQRVRRLRHYQRLEQKFRSSPVCRCPRCTLMHAWTGASQLRLL